MSRLHRSGACLLALALCACEGAFHAEEPEPLDALTGATQAGDAQPLELARFDASWDPGSGAWHMEVTPAVPSDLRSQRAALFCPLPLSGDDQALAITVDRAEVGFTPSECGFTGFPYDTQGVFCPSVALENTSAATLSDVYVRITAMNPVTGYEGYRFPLGTAADPATVPGAALTDDFGLWSYAALTPGESKTTTWLMSNAGAAFSYTGSILGSFTEAANGEDDDCDGRIDEGLSAYALGDACVDAIDCESGACTAGVCAANCGNGALEGDELCDDGNTTPGDGCDASCVFEGPYCGDGDATSPASLNVDDVTFRWSALNCAPGTTFSVEARINGTTVATKDSDEGCFCGAVSDGFVIDGATAGPLLETDGDNVFELNFGENSLVWWAKVTAAPSGEIEVFREVSANDAANEVDVPCGSPSVSAAPDFSVNSTISVVTLPDCDDGNRVNGDGCDNNCTFTGCGNGIVTDGEICDGGGVQTADCEVGCVAPACGDGVVNTLAGESCEDGNFVNGDGCSSTCRLEVCGDGTQQLSNGEQCDDGNLVNGDGCSGACLVEACGDGLLSLGVEECDDGNTDGGDGCSATCERECGDGAVQGVGPFSTVTLEVLVESCQTGSELVFLIDDHVAVRDDIPVTCDGVEAVRTYSIDDATSRALLSSGDRKLALRMGALEFGNAQLQLAWARLVFDGTTSVEIFDPGDRAGDPALTPATSAEYVSARFYNEACDGGAGCSAACRVVGCGNGVIEPGEACDDGNTADGDGCSASCLATSCGDGTRQASEECDDGNTADGDGCSASCVVEACGNGALDPGESCDDGGRIGGDGCDDTCAVESCGDGVRNVGEGCDDGNTSSGDGCSSTCQIEDCDPLADADGDRLNDCVETNTGRYLSPTNTGTDPNVADSDGDGMDDGDEVLGTVDGLGLAGLGANPNRRTIFLEIDYTTAPRCDFADYQPATWEVETSEDMFAWAPVSNRDGSLGIDLIIDDGRAAPLLGGNLLGSDDTLNDGLDSEFLGYKASNLDPKRVGVFHYAIITHSQGNGAGGLGEAPGDDFNVTQGCVDASVARMATIVHELGHNLNLFHGGNDSCNYKPNYNSIMSYANWGEDQNCDAVSEGMPTFSSGTNVDLNENAVDESRGVCGDVPVDFDGDGNIDGGSYSRDLNPDFSNALQDAFCGGRRTVLDDFDDWSNLVYSGPRGEAEGRIIPRIEVCDHHIRVAP